MFDLEIIESGNGGDLQLKGNDLATVQSWTNMPYLALFGHRGGVTKTSYAPGEQRTDWWGNALLHPQDPAAQFNSYTEDRLHDTPLTSAGRLLIEQAIIADLQFMLAFAEVEVSTAIVATDKLQINIRVRQPDNLQDKEYLFLWDATQQQLIGTGSSYLAPETPITYPALQYALPFNL